MTKPNAKKRTTRASASAAQAASAQAEEAKEGDEGMNMEIDPALDGSPVPSTSRAGVPEDVAMGGGVEEHEGGSAPPVVEVEVEGVHGAEGGEGEGGGGEGGAGETKDVGEGADVEERCPACPLTPSIPPIEKESWIRCDTCKTWFHWLCILPTSSTPSGQPIPTDALENIDKWYCAGCRAKNPGRRVITFKAPARKSMRVRGVRGGSSVAPGASSSVAGHTGAGVGKHGEGGGQEGEGGEGLPESNKWIRILQTKPIKPAPFRELKGTQLNKTEWIDKDEGAMMEPVVVRSRDREGLGIRMPWGWKRPSPKKGDGEEAEADVGEEFTVRDVRDIMGGDTPVEVIDVSTQSTSPNWTLARWAEYFHTPPKERDKIRNVISLEISGCEGLTKLIGPPRLVREVDWVERVWPRGKDGKKVPGFPKVQLYCLMGVATAWTDWHVDFAGSSVYYHIFSGAKTFYFIRPTPSNLSSYERWSSTELQDQVWLGDMCDEVFKVDLKSGDTMIIPTGWIHAVYTPVDTLVFGGNFLHSYNIQTQLKIRQIEITTRVPKKFRFPSFTKLCWYVADASLTSLRSKDKELLRNTRILKGLLALSQFLVSESKLIDSPSDTSNGNGTVAPAGMTQKRREAKEGVPGEKIKDPAAVARELRWRVRGALGVGSDDEGESPHAGGSVAGGGGGKRKAVNGNGNAGARKKVKVVGSANGSGSGKEREGSEGSEAGRVFKNFRPKMWEGMREVKGEEETSVLKGRRPPPPLDTGVDWSERWIADGDDDDDGMKVDGDGDGQEEGEEEEAKVTKRRDVIVKVRRTEKGLERQRIERVVEEWVWE